MSTTIHGVRYSDQLAALLDHVQSCEGWRVEPDTRGRTANGVIVYPADKTHSPITVEERKAQFNKAHYENLRRQLDRAGLPLMPAEEAAQAQAQAAPEPTPDPIPDLGRVVLAGSEAEALASLPPGTKPAILRAESMPGGGIGFGKSPAIEEILNDPDKAPGFLGEVTGGLARTAGLGIAEADLISTLVHAATDWALSVDPARLEALMGSVRETVAAEYETQITEALEMVADTERRLKAAEQRADRAEAKEAKARKDCGDALKRAKTAEAKATELERAIAPLRNLLNGAN